MLKRVINRVLETRDLLFKAIVVVAMVVGGIVIYGAYHDYHLKRQLQEAVDYINREMAEAADRSEEEAGATEHSAARVLSEGLGRPDVISRIEVQATDGPVTVYLQGDASIQGKRLLLQDLDGDPYTRQVCQALDDIAQEIVPDECR